MATVKRTCSDPNTYQAGLEAGTGAETGSVPLSAIEPLNTAAPFPANASPTLPSPISLTFFHIGDEGRRSQDAL